jgi:uncharacterized protein with FMN-binding domain
MKKGNKLKRVLLSGLVVIVIIVGIFFIGLQMKLKEISSQINNIDIEDIDITNVEDGVYKGEYYMDDLIGASIEVMVENNKIKSIDFLDHKYGKGQKAEAIIDTVIERQSLEVDAIAGATGSSITILKAIENALIN